MKKRMMAVYDVDPFFADRFAEAANQREQIPFTVMAFSTMERLKQFSREQKIEILLIDAGLRGEAEEIEAEQVIYLSDGELLPEKGDAAWVYKYQSTANIVREVMGCYCVQPAEPKVAVGNKSILLGVYSPVNRCLKTSFSLILGQLLAKENKVLYLNLEDCSGFRKLMGQEGNGDFSDVLYYYGQWNGNWARLKSLVYHWDNLDYILPARYPEDLCQFSAEQMANLLEQIGREGIYDMIIVDLGQLGKMAVHVLEVCDGIYMPIKQDWFSMAKVEEYEEYIKVSGHGALLEKTQKLNLPYSGRFADRKNYLEELLWGELGDYVRQVLRGKQKWR